MKTPAKIALDPVLTNCQGDQPSDGMRAGLEPLKNMIKTDCAEEKQDYNFLVTNLLSLSY